MSMTYVAVRPRTVDATPGILLWNNLYRDERHAWLTIAKSAVPADAYRLRCGPTREILGGVSGTPTTPRPDHATCRVRPAQLLWIDRQLKTASRCECRRATSGGT